MKTQLPPVDQVGNIVWLVISGRDNTGCTSPYCSMLRCCADLNGTLAKTILEKWKNLGAVLCSSLTHKCCEVTGKKLHLYCIHHGLQSCSQILFLSQPGPKVKRSRLFTSKAGWLVLQYLVALETIQRGAFHNQSAKTQQSSCPARWDRKGKEG